MMAEISLDGLKQDLDTVPEGVVSASPPTDSLRALVATVPGVIWEAWGHPLLPHRRIAYVSDYVEQMMGFPVENWLSNPNFWLEVVHPEDQQRASDETAAIFDACGTGFVTFRWITKSEQVIWVKNHLSVVCSESGEPVGLRGVTFDITSQKTAETTLRENEERITSLFQRLRESVLQTQDRIGNNLQFIASLLEEQILEFAEAVPLTELRQVRLRLMMLAEVQTIITKAFREHEDIDHISARDILEVLPDMFTSETRFRPLHIEADEIYLTAARVNSLAIIASELIGNAYRYGKGAVYVELRRVPTKVRNKLVFTVRDEGDGFPENFKPHESINTGLNLVQSLAWSGLEGEVAFGNQPYGGACIILKFPPNE